MKKRNFLIPLASLVAALGVNSADATSENSEIIINNKVDASTLITVKNEFTDPFSFTLQRSNEIIRTADHSSHASHSSHGSHASHSSGR